MSKRGQVEHILTMVNLKLRPSPFTSALVYKLHYWFQLWSRNWRFLNILCTFPMIHLDWIQHAGILNWLPPVDFGRLWVCRIVIGPMKVHYGVCFLQFIKKGITLIYIASIILTFTQLLLYHKIKNEWSIKIDVSTASPFTATQRAMSY